MPTFYFEHNLRRHFNAPQFTRTRHRLRGVRESEKINLEIGQMYYSLHKLYKTYGEFQHRFVSKATGIIEGETIDIEVNEDGPINIVGLYDLVARIDMLQRRVKALEA